MRVSMCKLKLIYNKFNIIDTKLMKSGFINRCFLQSLIFVFNFCYFQFIRQTPTCLSVVDFDFLNM